MDEAHDRCALADRGRAALDRSGAHVTGCVDAGRAGREQSVRSIITQISSFMGQLDANKESIVTALENVNRLSLELRRQDGTIKSALDDLPAAIKSINGQRADLVRMGVPVTGAPVGRR